MFAKKYLATEEEITGAFSGKTEEFLSHARYFEFMSKAMSQAELSITKTHFGCHHFKVSLTGIFETNIETPSMRLAIGFSSKNNSFDGHVLYAIACEKATKKVHVILDSKISKSLIQNGRSPQANALVEFLEKSLKMFKKHFLEFSPELVLFKSWDFWIKDCMTARSFLVALMYDYMADHRFDKRISMLVMGNGPVNPLKLYKSILSPVYFAAKQPVKALDEAYELFRVFKQSMHLALPFKLAETENPKQLVHKPILEKAIS